MVKPSHKLNEIQGQDWDELLVVFGDLVIKPVLGRPVYPLNARRSDTELGQRGITSKVGTYALSVQNERDVIVVSFNDNASLGRAPEEFKVAFRNLTRKFILDKISKSSSTLMYVMQ